MSQRAAPDTGPPGGPIALDQVVGDRSVTFHVWPWTWLNAYAAAMGGKIEALSRYQRLATVWITEDFAQAGSIADAYRHQQQFSAVQVQVDRLSTAVVTGPGLVTFHLGLGAALIGLNPSWPPNELTYVVTTDDTTLNDPEMGGALALEFRHAALNLLPFAMAARETPLNDHEVGGIRLASFPGRPDVAMHAWSPQALVEAAPKVLGQTGLVGLCMPGTPPYAHNLRPWMRLPNSLLKAHSTMVVDGISYTALLITGRQPTPALIPLLKVGRQNLEVPPTAFVFKVARGVADQPERHWLLAYMLGSMPALTT